MPSFREGIESQPENLARGAELFAQALAGTDLAALREGTIVLSGIGASWHALKPSLRALRAAGRRAFAVPAAELARTRGLGDCFVLVSQSGASRELLDALPAVAGHPAVAISARGDSPLVRELGSWLPLGPLPDTPVSTLAYTATLQALALLCDALLGGEGRRDALPELVGDLISRHDAGARELGGRLAQAVAIDTVGGGAAAASAGEAALLVREGLRVAATGAETREYLHGPLEAVAPGFAALLFGAERELELAAELASYGAVVAAVAARGRAPEGVQLFELPPVEELIAPILEIVPVQLTVLHAAAARGLDISELRRQQTDTKVAA